MRTAANGGSLGAQLAQARGELAEAVEPAERIDHRAVDVGVGEPRERKGDVGAPVTVRVRRPPPTSVKQSSS